MITKNGLVLVSALLGTSACVVVDNHHGGVGGSVPLSAPVSDIVLGAGVTINPGVQAGYGITANTGISYRIVWTGDAGVSGGYREFWGSAWTTGTFVSVTPGCANNVCALESDDFLSQPITLTTGGQRIDWDTFASDGLDGFDFVASTEPIYVDTYIDGQRYPQLVTFTDASTGNEASAPALPFGLESPTTH